MGKRASRREARVTYRATGEELRELRRKAAYRRLSAGAFLRELVHRAPGPTQEEGRATNGEVAKALRACGALTPEESRALDAALAAFREEGAWEG